MCWKQQTVGFPGAWFSLLDLLCQVLCLVPECDSTSVVFKAISEYLDHQEDSQSTVWTPGLGRGPRIYISNISQVVLMLLILEPHFENHYIRFIFVLSEFTDMWGRQVNKQDTSDTLWQIKREVKIWAEIA